MSKKNKLAISLLCLTSVFTLPSYADHHDLYKDKSTPCEKDCRGYWGFGLGWQNSEFTNDPTITVTSTGDKINYKFKDDKNNFSGKIYIGYNFYNNNQYGFSFEFGTFGAAKKLKSTIIENPSRVNPNNFRRVLESHDRHSMPYASIKPHYSINDMWSIDAHAGVAVGYFDFEYELSETNRFTGDVIRITDIKAKRIVPGWTLGIGVTRDINKNWKVSLDYDFVRLTDDSTELTNAVATTKSDLQIDSHLVTLNLVHDFNCA